MRDGAAPPSRRATPSRRRLLVAGGAAVIGAVTGRAAAVDESGRGGFTLFTFGDSVLDCGVYNAFGLHPGGLIVRNDDARFPDFKGRDLRSSRGAVRLEHRAVDGATVDGLATQARGLRPPPGPGVALLTVGGNDLLRGLAGDAGPGLRRFEGLLNRFLQALPVRPVLLGTVYDPTFGDDALNFLPIEPRLARANLRRVNQAIGESASRFGALVDLHAHFLQGDPSWYTRIIEPSLTGASEIRRAFLPALGLPG